MGSRNLTDTAILPQRGGSDSTVARTCQATGETLLAPGRNHRSRVDRITGLTGKSIDGERVAGATLYGVVLKIFICRRPPSDVLIAVVRRHPDWPCRPDRLPFAGGST